jgi:hypothetical protein
MIGFSTSVVVLVSAGIALAALWVASRHERLGADRVA